MLMTAVVLACRNFHRNVSGRPVDRRYGAVSGSLAVSDAVGRHVTHPETTLDPGETYVVAVEPDVLDEVMNLMRG
jgi:Trk K+ transport system NAD-binding subunit